LSDRFEQILRALTGVRGNVQQARKEYCLTGDALLKMLAIYVRIRCGIPVVLCGECGCGKTELIRFLCMWLGVPLLVLDIHGGTTEADIIAIFHKAERALSEGASSVYVFLDEVNACAHMGLIAEAVCQRSLQGRPFSKSIEVLCALNPHRRRKDTGETAGLVYAGGNRAQLQDEMRHLVYRVHRVPPALQDFIFDFGSLSPATELLYIQSMVANRLSMYFDSERELAATLIHASQTFVREAEDEVSAVSLRDVKRCLTLMIWFSEALVSPQSRSQDGQQQQQQQQQQQRDTPVLSTRAYAMILGLAFVYFFRLKSDAIRADYWITLRSKGNFVDRHLRTYGCVWPVRACVCGHLGSYLPSESIFFFKRFAHPFQLLTPGRARCARAFADNRATKVVQPLRDRRGHRHECGPDGESLRHHHLYSQ
jgi:hypothetical protein